VVTVYNATPIRARHTASYLTAAAAVGTAGTDVGLELIQVGDADLLGATTKRAALP